MFCDRFCDNLQYLSIAYCQNYTDRGMYYLTNGNCSKRLTYLDLSGCNQVSHDTYTVSVGVASVYDPAPSPIYRGVLTSAHRRL